MLGYITILVLCGLLAAISLTIFIYSFFHNADSILSEETICFGIMSLVFCVVLGIGLRNIEQTTIDNATEFFNNRANVYSECSKMSNIQCKYMLKKWRQDSVWWAHQVNEILENDK